MRRSVDRTWAVRCRATPGPVFRDDAGERAVRAHREEESSMNARAQTSNETERPIVEHFVFASSDEGNVHWLAGALAETGMLEPTAREAAVLSQRIAALRPSLVFVDFSGPLNDLATRAVQTARAVAPHVPIVAVGKLAEPEGAVAALRAGVRDFVDVGGSPSEAARIAREVLEN